MEDGWRMEKTRSKPDKTRNILPGFGLTLGCAVTYLCVIVLIPLCGVVLKTLELSWDRFVDIVTSTRVLASFRVTILASLAAAIVNAIFGYLVAWVLVRYSFPGKRIVDALIDLPFALPTAVAGICLTAIYSQKGWIGSLLEPLGIRVAFTPLGIVVALIFIGLPFVVRTVQPVLQELDRDAEEAATVLGASDRFRARLFACDRRVRVGGVHFRKYADENGNRAAAYRDEARAVRLCRSNGDRARHAGGVLRALVCDQRVAVAERAANRREIGLGRRCDGRFN